jgi:predicted O-methyltransferase YrrM
MSSLEASKLFNDDSLDFVFIDAAHDYDNVVADLKAWYPKIKKGGVLAGHDFYPDQPTWCDVYKAVKDVFGTNYLEIEGSCFAIRK